VRDLRRRGYPHRLEPAELVAAIGSAELATAAGFVLEAAARRTPVLLDGLAAVAAALLAYEAKPRAVRWWRLADRTPVPAHELAATTMALEPVLDLGLRLADGTAGALAVTVLRAAVRMVLTDSAAVGSASTGDESADGSADNGSADNADQDATGDVPADRGER
jgi:nicotinate-nucleotide--dimethylbenzimidazole phosphoribosyltransferase